MVSLHLPNPADSVACSAKHPACLVETRDKALGIAKRPSRIKIAGAIPFDWEFGFQAASTFDEPQDLN